MFVFTFYNFFPLKIFNIISSFVFPSRLVLICKNSHWVFFIQMRCGELSLENFYLIGFDFGLSFGGPSHSMEQCFPLGNCP